MDAIDHYNKMTAICALKKIYEASKFAEKIEFTEDALICLLLSLKCVKETSW